MGIDSYKGILILALLYYVITGIEFQGGLDNPFVFFSGAGVALALCFLATIVDVTRGYHG